MTITDPVLFAALLRFIADTNLRHRGNPGTKEILNRFASWSSSDIHKTVNELFALGYISYLGNAKPNQRTLYAVTETGLSRLRGVTA